MISISSLIYCLENCRCKKIVNFFKKNYEIFKSFFFLNPRVSHSQSIILIRHFMKPIKPLKIHSNKYFMTVMKKLLQRHICCIYFHVYHNFQKKNGKNLNIEGKIINIYWRKWHWLLYILDKIYFFIHSRGKLVKFWCMECFFLKCSSKVIWYLYWCEFFGI